MPPISDPPTAAQVAQIIERLNNLAEDMREVRTHQTQATQMLIEITAMRRDMTHLEGKVRHLFTVADARGPEVASIDKRLASIERLNKVIGTVLLASLGLVSWTWQRIETLYRMENRLGTLELIVQNQSLERAMQPPRTQMEVVK